MALDTATKRRSMLGMGIMALVIAPVADGTLSSVDRLHIMGMPGAVSPASPGVDTSNIHIFSTSKVEPNHVSDSGDNVLVVGQLEAQGGGYFGGASNYTNIEADGDIVQVGTGRIHESAKYKLTALGGFSVTLTNKTGVNPVAGQLVAPY